MLKHLNLKYLLRALAYFKKNDWRSIRDLIQSKLLAANYQRWFYKYHLPSALQLQQQKITTFAYQPKISLIVAVYNPPLEFFQAMLNSVLQQTYSNWELCLADASIKNGPVQELLAQITGNEPRIKLISLASNLHISGNSNQALSLATGEYIGLLDHDDELTINALFEVVKALNESGQIDFIYSDEDFFDTKRKKLTNPHFKSDFNHHLLYSHNYITHFAVIRRELVLAVGGFDSRFDGAQDYDLFLKIIEKTSKIYHISKVLYHWRMHSGSTALSGSGAKGYTHLAGKKALSEHFHRQGIKAEVIDGVSENFYKINFALSSMPLISIFIPNKDHYLDLKKCLDSILLKSSYPNFEIIIIENNSSSPEIFDYYRQLQANYPKIKVLSWVGNGFNYSALNNYAATFAGGEYLLLLNNDVEVITSNWLEEMLMYCQLDAVGIVGAKLYYPDLTIQHSGIGVGLANGVAAHLNFSASANGYFNRQVVVQNLSAVTGACLMIKKSIFKQLNGLDEVLAVAYNDVDLCLRVCQLGYLVVFNPYCELYHYESKSRGLESSKEHQQRFLHEIDLFAKKWGLWMNDPYYNPNFLKVGKTFHLLQILPR